MPAYLSHKVPRLVGERGVNGSVTQMVVVGFYRSPEAFYEEAKALKHPRDLPSMVPDLLKRSAFNKLTFGPEQLLRRRCLCLKDLLARATSLQKAEDELHSKMDPGTARVLKGKRLLLLESVLKDVQHPDLTLVQEIIKGFPLTGNAAESQVFVPESLGRPPELRTVSAGKVPGQGRSSRPGPSRVGTPQLMKRFGANRFPRLSLGC